MPDLVTVGVLICVPEPHSTVLTGWRHRVGDPLASVIPPHVTLLPPTDLPRADLDAIDKHLVEAARACDPFAMHLFGTGTFRPLTPVVFIQVARGIAECEVLEKAIRSGPLGRKLDFPYHPHVTVAQEVGDDALDEAYEALSAFVARFLVSGFSLFVKDLDQPWAIRKNFPLGAA
ncbi:MAG: 2'-5' RNA ligase family protein [Actinobacteria bacterium]|nr:2'-5' RNA ligase family protein [Actinomycetota bacterium]